MKKLKDPKTIGVRLDKEDYRLLKTIASTPTKAIRKLLNDYRSISRDGAAPQTSKESCR